MSMKEGESSSWALGRIENKAVSLQDYLKSYKASQHQLELFYGDKAREVSRQINLKGQAWDRLLLLHYAKKEKLKTSDSEVVDWISKQFSLKGKFDDALYKRYVDVALRSNPREFEEEVRESLTISKISEKLKTGISLTEAELKKAYDEAHGKKDIVYGFQSWEIHKDTVKVSDTELQNVFAVVKDNLTEPEKVRLSYLFIPKDAPESLKSALAEKEITLDALSTKYKLPLKETGLFSKNEYVPDIGASREAIASAFSLSQGEESGWIEAEKGSYKIKSAEKKAERKLSFEEAKAELTKIMTRDSAIKETVKTLEASRKDLNPADFETWLAKNNLQIQKLDQVKPGDSLPLIGNSSAPLFQEKLLKLKEGEVSAAFAVSNGAAIVKVLKNTPGDGAKYAEEKEEFRKTLLSKTLDESMQKILTDLRGKLKLDIELMKKLFPTDEPQTAAL